MHFSLTGVHRICGVATKLHSDDACCADQLVHRQPQNVAPLAELACGKHNTTVRSQQKHKFGAQHRQIEMAHPVTVRITG